MASRVASLTPLWAHHDQHDAYQREPCARRFSSMSEGNRRAVRKDLSGAELTDEILLQSLCVGAVLGPIADEDRVHRVAVGCHPPRLISRLVSPSENAICCVGQPAEPVGPSSPPEHP